MKQILLMIAVRALVGGCGGKKAEPTKVVPEKLIANPIVEEAIRRILVKYTGKLTKADLKKVLVLHNKQLTDIPKDLEKLTPLTRLHLAGNKLSDVTGLEKLTQLKFLYLKSNPDLTKAQIDELKKALPKCKFYSNAKK